MSKDPYQEVTDRIVSALERGTVPWRKPWSVASGQPRSINGRPYNGINAILLGMSEYSDPRWTTFKRAHDHGGRVRKGEHGTFVVFFKPLVIRERDETGRMQVRSVPLLKWFYVFNVEQCDGLDIEPWTAAVRENPAIDAADRVYDEYPARPVLGHGGSRAFYRPADDLVMMPDREHFTSSDAYYLTLWHELTHSTGHASRLARSDLADMERFGDHNYSREELCAEMGSAMIAARIGIVAPDIEQSAAYIASWLRALRSDKRMVVSAASRAQHAADHILGAVETEEQN